MKTNYSIERKEKIGNLNKGKSISEEIRNKISLKAKYRVRIFSDEALLNMKKSSKAIVLYNLDKTVFG